MNDLIDVLQGLARSYSLVAIVTGRPGRAVRELVPVQGVEVFGLYGLERNEVESPGPEVREELARLVAELPGAWIEDKGASLTVHYRGTADPDAAGPLVARRVRALAARRGLAVVKGKRAVEVATADIPGKGAVVEQEVRSRGLRACLYAGDDLADLEAFAALDGLRSRGIHAVKVAVRSAETPPEVEAAADLVMPGPAGLVGMLAGLAR